MENGISEEQREFVLKMMRETPDKYKNLSEELKKDKAITMVAIMREPAMLKFAPEVLKNDKGVVDEAYKIDNRSLQFASLMLRSDNQFMFEKIQHNPHVIGYCSSPIKDLPVFMVEYAKKHGKGAIEYGKKWQEKNYGIKAEPSMFRKILTKSKQYAKTATVSAAVVMALASAASLYGTGVNVEVSNTALKAMEQCNGDSIKATQIVKESFGEGFEAVKLNVGNAINSTLGGTDSLIEYYVNEAKFEFEKNNSLESLNVVAMTDKEIESAVKNDGLALKHVKLQTPKIISEALLQNGYACEYINEGIDLEQVAQQTDIMIMPLMDNSVTFKQIEIPQTMVSNAFLAIQEWISVQNIGIGEIKAMFEETERGSIDKGEKLETVKNIDSEEPAVRVALR